MSKLSKGFTNAGRLMLLAILALTFLVPAEAVQAQPGMKMGRVIILLTSDSDVSSAKVYINGKIKGTARRGQGLKRVTPFGSGKKTTIELRSGEHTKKKTVVLSGKRWKTVRFTIKTVKNGAIRVIYSRNSDYKTAKVYLNGKYKGRVRKGRRKTLKNLKPRTYTVEVKSGRAAMKRRVRVRSGKTTSKPFNLNRPYGKLYVKYSKNSDYRYAYVYVDGKRKARLNKGQGKWLKKLKPGKYKVELRYRRSRKARTVSIKAGETERITMSLKEPVGFITVHLTGDSGYKLAKVYVNGKYKGLVRRGKNKKLTLKAGEYDIKVARKGEAMTRKLQVQRGKGRTVNFTLQSRPTLRVTMRDDSSVVSARLYLDGKYVKRIRRGQTRVFRVEPDNKLRVVIRRGKKWYSRKIISIDRGQTKKVEFGLY